VHFNRCTLLYFKGIIGRILQKIVEIVFKALILPTFVFEGGSVMLQEGANFRFIKDVMIVNLKGELDHHIADRIKEDIDYAMSKKNIKKILFNFKNVTFMDSSGIGMLLGGYKSIKSIGGALGVCNVNERIKKVFDISGLFSIIPCYTDENEAVEKL